MGKVPIELCKHENSVLLGCPLCAREKMPSYAAVRFELFPDPDREAVARVLTLPLESPLSGDDMTALWGAFMGSIDAAARLLPHGAVWEIKSSYWRDGGPAAMVDPGNGRPRRYGNASTPALSLALAAIRTRERK